MDFDRMQWPLMPSEDRSLWSTAWSEDRSSNALAFANPTGLAFDGEVYNRPELCRQLELPADTPLENLLLAGSKRWSPSGLMQRLDGVFALAVRDGDGLLLYRDPSGLRNLYGYTGRSGRMAFATHLDTLLNLPGVDRLLSHRSLHEYLRFLDIAAPNTLFEGVVAPEPGKLLHWSARGMELRHCGSPEDIGTAPRSFLDAVDWIDKHLQESVRARLENVRRPAAFLSGGIDSALLCAMAAHHRHDTTAVTVGFEGSAYDEAPVAQRIAAHLQMKHEILRFSRRDYLSAFNRLSQHMEQPMADPATPATVLAFDQCRDRFDAVLDGTGADEAVGMLPPRHVRVAVEWASLLPRSVRSGLTRMLNSAPSLADFAPLFNFEHPADTMIRWSGFTRLEIESLCGEPVSFQHTHFYQTFRRYPRRAHFERFSALLNAMPCDRLNQSMLVSGANVRYPFCQAETDRFIRQLPTHHRYLPGQPKRVLRTLLTRYVPVSLWDLPKHGFSFPLNAFLVADGCRLVRHHLDAARWRQSGVLSHAKVENYARQFMAGDHRLTFRVWALVVLGAWLEKHDQFR